MELTFTAHVMQTVVSIVLMLHVLRYVVMHAVMLALPVLIHADGSVEHVAHNAARLAVKHVD